ncbi:MAG: hypothetical protein RLZZ511_1203 [Cyanobacteriota bacterium]
MQKAILSTTTAFGTIVSVVLAVPSSLKAETTKTEITTSETTKAETTKAETTSPPLRPVAQAFRSDPGINNNPTWRGEIVQAPPAQDWQSEVSTASQPVWASGSESSSTNLAQQAISDSVDLDSAESPAELTPEAVQAVELQLDSYKAAPKAIVKPYRANPGITLSVPSGFGSDRGRISTGLGLQRTRANTNDGAASIGIGLGNAQTGIGVQLSYTTYSINPEKLLKKEKRTILSSDRPFGAGGFNLKIHKQFKNGLSVAVGGDSILNIGPPGVNVFGTDAKNELEGTYYASATKLFRLKPDINEPFSSLSVTVGAGIGPRFQPLQSVREDKKIVTPFASAALRLTPNASAIAEWSGQDFGVALSWVPFRNLPIVLTPAIRDLFGPDAKKPRFVMGFGLGL